MRRLLPLLLVAGLLAPVTPADADAGPAVTTSVREVSGAKATSGSSTMLAYVLEHEVHEDVPPEASLPGARIDRTDHPEAFDGLWLQDGEIGAWFGGPSDDANTQFRPSGTLLEDLDVENEVWRNGELPPVVGEHRTIELPGVSDMSFGHGSARTPGAVVMEDVVVHVPILE